MERQRRAVDHRLEQRRSFPYDSKSGSWGRWHLQATGRSYAVYVDEADAWISDWEQTDPALVSKPRVSILPNS